MKKSMNRLSALPQRKLPLRTRRTLLASAAALALGTAVPALADSVAGSVS